MPMKPTIFILCFILFTCYKNSNARDHNIPDVKTFTFKEAGGEASRQLRRKSDGGR